MNYSHTPIEYYQNECNAGLIIEDKQQLYVLNKLQDIYFKLIDEHRKRSGYLSVIRKSKLVNGLYLWGGVGMGKTFLLDCFYNCLPFENKMRVHFHQFMKYIHHELKIHQGKKNPIEIIANAIADNNLVLCFDEFFVTDITDAMILARLLEALFTKGVCLVTTSNIVPDELYKRGLQREQFLPAIELIRNNTKVMYIPSLQDYRLRHLNNAGVFYTPINELSRNEMEKTFQVLTRGKPISHDNLVLYGREIKVLKSAGAVIWFDFNVICRSPRSQLDYLEISKRFSTVFISNIPVISPDSKDIILLFIRMIDVFYDARIKLVLLSEASVQDIYSEGQMLFDYQRTCSRLLEMQSEHYFSRDLLN